MVASFNNRLILSGMAGLIVAMGIGRFAFTPVLPMMVGDGWMTVAEGGWLASANYVGYFVGALAGSLFAWRTGLVLKVGLAVITIATVAMGIATSFWTWGILRFIAGVASAAVFIAISARCIGSLKPESGGLSNGWLFGGVGAGIFLTGVLCLGLMAFETTAQNAWKLIGGAALLGSLAVVITLGSSLDVEKRAGFIGWPKDSAKAILMVACYGIFGFGYIIPATFLPAMAKELVSDPWLFGWAWPVFGLAAWLSTIVAARQFTRLNNRNLWALSALVMAVGVVLPVWFNSLTAVILSGLMVGGTFMVITMAGMQEATVTGGIEASRLVAMMTASFAMGQVLGPVVMSMLLTHGAGFQLGLSIAGALLLISALAIRDR